MPGLTLPPPLSAANDPSDVHSTNKVKPAGFEVWITKALSNIQREGRIPTPEQGRSPKRRLSEGDTMSMDGKQSPPTNSRTEDSQALYIHPQAGVYQPIHDGSNFGQAFPPLPSSGLYQPPFSQPQVGLYPLYSSFADTHPEWADSAASSSLYLHPEMGSEASGHEPSATIGTRPLASPRPPRSLSSLRNYATPGAQTAGFSSAANMSQTAAAEGDLEEQDTQIENPWDDAHMDDSLVVKAATQDITSWRNRADRSPREGRSRKQLGAEASGPPAEANSEVPSSSRRLFGLHRILEVRRGGRPVANPAPLREDVQAQPPPARGEFRSPRGQKRGREADTLEQSAHVGTEQRSTALETPRKHWSKDRHNARRSSVGQTGQSSRSAPPTQSAEADQSGSYDHVPDRLMGPFMEILLKQGEVAARKFLKESTTESPRQRTWAVKRKSKTKPPTKPRGSAMSQPDYMDHVTQKPHGLHASYDEVFNPSYNDPYGGSAAFCRMESLDGTVIADDPGVYGIGKIQNANGVTVARALSRRGGHSEDHQTPRLNKKVVDIHIDDDLVGAAQADAPIEKFRRLMGSSPLAGRGPGRGRQEEVVGEDVGVGLGTPSRVVEVEADDVGTPSGVFTEQEEGYEED